MSVPPLKILESPFRLTVKFIRFSSWLAISVGFLVICGWLLDLPTLKSVFPGFATMKFNTALCFVFLGIAIRAAQNEKKLHSSALARTASRIFYSTVAVVALMSLSEYILDINFGIDDFFFKDLHSATYPGRMAPLTGIIFILLSGALFLLDGTAGFYRCVGAQVFSLLSTALSLSAVVGYVYQVEAIYKIYTYSSIALHTAVTLLMVSLSTLLLRSHVGIVSVFYGNRAGSKFGSRLVLTIVPILIFLGWFGHLGFKRELYDIRFTSVVIALSSIIIISGVIFWNAHRLNELDLIRQKAELATQEAKDTLTRLNEELETRIKKRTAELTETSEMLNLALKSAHIGSWSWDIVTNHIDWDENMEQLFGVTKGAYPPTLDHFQSKVHLDDLPAVKEALENSIKLKIPYKIDYRITWPDGSLHYISACGETTFSSNGSPKKMTGVCWDITAQKQAFLDLESLKMNLEQQVQMRTEELLRSETLLRLITDNIPALVSYIDINHRYRYVNAGYEKWFGKTRKEVVGQSMKETLGDQAYLKLLPFVDTALSGQPISFEQEIPYRGGGTRFVHADYVPDIDEHGSTNGLFVMVSDLSALKRSEDALRLSDENFRQLADSMPQMVWTARPDGYLDYYNERWYEYTGFERGRGGDQSWEPILHPDDVKHAHDTFYSAIRNHTPFQTECRFKDRQTGGYRWFLGRALPVFDHAGNVSKWFGTCTDIHDQKIAEEKVQKSEFKFRRIYDSNLVGLVFWTRQGAIVDANDAFLESVGYSRDDLKEGKIDWQNMTPSEWNEADIQALNQLAENGVAPPFEKEYFKKDGSKIPVIIGAATLEDVPGIDGIAYILDISKRKNLEREREELLTVVKAANDQLEQRVHERTEDLARSNAELEQFAYVASHDLREPLRMVTNYAELLEKRYKGKLDESADKFIGYMVEGVGRMQLLISDLLAYSRVGKTDSSIEAISMDDLIKDTLKNLEAAIKESQAIVTIGPLPEIQADYLLMQQLMQNLLSNAVKFHKKDIPPQIRVSAELINKEWVFSISDNGIGIDPQYADRIFIIFQRLHNRTEYPGTGIGLAICKKIVGRLGGRIWMESIPDKGATFYFSLPGDISQAAFGLTRSITEKKRNAYENKTC